MKSTPLLDILLTEESNEIEKSQRLNFKGLQQVVCEDNLSFMKRFPSEKFKLIVTSPPYNLGKEYESKAGIDEYLANQKQVIEECIRLLHPNGSICWQVGNYVSNGEIVPIDSLLYPIFKSLNLRLNNRIIWYFGHGLHCAKRLSGRYETINW